MIIPRDIRKKQTLRGFSYMEVCVIFSIYLGIEIFTDINSLVVTVTSILCGYTLVSKVSSKSLYEIIIDQATYMYSKVYFFRDRELFLETRFEYEPIIIRKPNDRIGKLVFPFKRMQVKILNGSNKLKLHVSRNIYELINYRDSTLNEGEYDKYSISFDEHDQMIINQNDNLFVVKKLVPKYTKWFDNQEQRFYFVSELYKFYEQNLQMSIYKYHDTNTYNFYDFDTKGIKVLELYKKYQLGVYEKLLSQSVPYFYVTIPYEGKKVRNIGYKQCQVLTTEDCIANDVDIVDNIILGDINDVQELQIKKDHIVMILNDGDRYYQKYMATTDIALKQEELYLEELLKEPRIDIKIEYKQYNRNEIIKAMDNSIDEAVMRIDDTEKTSKKYLESQEIRVISNYLEQLNNKVENIVGFKLIVKIEADTLEELQSLEESIKENYENLQLDSELFVQKQLLNEWVLLKEVKDFKELSMTHLAYGGLFNYSKIEDDRGHLKYVGSDGLIAWNSMDYDKNPDRITNSKFISGKTGSGKTTLIKMILLEYAAEGRGVYNIDVQGDYVSLFEELGGETIHIGHGSVINPLQVTDWTCEDPINNHLSFLVSFFSIGNPNYYLIADKMTKRLSEFYTGYNLTEESKNNEYPKLDELYTYLEETGENEEILEFVHKYSHTILRSYFNGYTSIDLSNEYINFCITDIKDDDVKLNPILVTLLNFMRKKLYDASKQNAFILDESHRAFANEYLTRFSVTTARECRKFDSEIDFISQSPEDIPMSVLSQMQYKIFLKNDNMKLISEITNKSIDFLPNLKSAEFGEGFMQEDERISPINFNFNKTEIIDNIELLYIFDKKILKMLDDRDKERLGYI